MGLFSAVSSAHRLTSSELAAEQRTKDLKDLKVRRICDICGTEGPLMIDLDLLRADLGGRWEDPQRFFKQMQEPKYQRVVCKCTRDEDNA